MTTEGKLTNVHEALAKAATEPSTPTKQLEQYSFRLHEEVGTKCREICARHNTTISEFLRQCCQGLVDDYQS